MTTMYWLWFGVVAMLLLSLAVLLAPLLKEGTPPILGKDEASLRTLYRGQLAELGQEHIRGNLGNAEHVQAVDELHRRLLQELDRHRMAGSWQRNPWLHRASALVLALLLPVLSLALYKQVGDPRAAAQLAQTAAGAHGESAGEVNGAQIQAMIESLAARLRAEPQNLDGWIMLARSYDTLERFDDAARAYGEALKEAGRRNVEPAVQARLHADRADVLASARGGDLEGPAGAAITQALLLDPRQPKALALAGTAAARRGDITVARQHWKLLLAQLEPGSDMALRVQDDLLTLENLGQAPSATSSPDTTATPATPDLALEGELRFQNGLEASPLPSTAKVYVVVRAENHAPPVAVLRLSATPLPTSFRIGAAQLLDPSFAFTQQTRLTLQARLSHSGEALPEAGDIVSPAIRTSRRASGLRLLLQAP